MSAWLFKYFLTAAAILTLKGCFALQSEGKSFVLTFFDNKPEYWQDNPLEVWVMNNGDVSAHVSISTSRAADLLQADCSGPTTATVLPRQQYMFTVCWWGKLMSSDKSIANKGIRVDSNTDISVLAVNKGAYSTASYLIQPISSLGTEYYTIAAHRDVIDSSSFAVVASEDDTSVTISLPLHSHGRGLSLVHQCLVYEEGSTFTIKLSALQVFHAAGLADITGLKILASRPVAVFNGNSKIRFPSIFGSRDHMCEQAISVGNWDREYVYAPVSADSRNLIRLFSDRQHTTVVWTTNNGSRGVINLHGGQATDFTPFDYVYLSSTHKFTAVLVTSSGLEGVRQGSAMINMQGINQWTTVYTLPPFHSFQSSTETQPQHHEMSEVIVFMESQFLTGLVLDGRPVTWSLLQSCVSIPRVGSACRIPVIGGAVHVLKHSLSGVKFGAFMSTSSTKECHGTSLGFTFPPQCELSVMRRADGLDNDCDGEVDEEQCDGVDNDMDGLTDEDCSGSSRQARGQAYLLAFPDNSKSDSKKGELDQLQLYISPQNTMVNTEVKVRNPLGSYFVRVVAPAFQTTVIDVPVVLRLPKGSGIHSKGLLVQADHDIVVYALNKRKFSSESYLALPIDVIGYDYYVATSEVKDSGDAAELAVCAADPGNTVLEITLANIEGVKVELKGVWYGPADVMLTTLRQYECLQLQSKVDLTGTRVLSKNRRKISVFSGNRRGVIGEGSSRDHIVEQITPVPAWGREFYTQPIKRNGRLGEERGDIFRVIASQDSTIVSVFSHGSKMMHEIALRGQFLQLEMSSSDYSFISTSKPAMLVQYTKSQLTKDPSQDQGDPSMTLVTSKDSWTNDYRFVTPRSGQLNVTTGEYTPYNSKMNIAIEKQFLSKLRYGSPLYPFSAAFPSAVWVDIPGTNPVVSATTVHVEFGQNYVTAVEGKVFSAVLYGSADREFYSHPMSLRLLSTDCRLTSQVLADVKDNDCDERIDEELCNGIDDDRDGLVDGDCSLPTNDNQMHHLLVFMQNKVEYPVDTPLTIVVSSRCTATTSVRLRTPKAPVDRVCDVSVLIPAGGVQRYALSSWFRPEGSTISHKAILVESSCPVDVAAYNMDRFSNDAFLVLPISKLGREYRALCYHPSTLGTVVAVVATDNTDIYVSLPPHSGSASPSVHHPTTNATYIGGQSFPVRLAKYEAVQLVAENGGDLSGTVITSAHADIAVFSGNIRVSIGAKSRDHIVEQLPPWTTSASSWVVATNGLTQSEYVKFTCDPGVTITFPGDLPQTFTFAGPSWNYPQFPDYHWRHHYLTAQVKQVKLPQFYAGRVEATGRCQLMLITTSWAEEGKPWMGDPAMSLIVPISQHISQTSFAIPSKLWTDRQDGHQDYLVTLVLVAKTEDINSIRLDGSQLAGWSRVDETFSITRQSLTRKAGGAAYALKSDNQEKFDARLYGVADRESFAYPLGMQL